MARRTLLWLGRGLALLAIIFIASAATWAFLTDGYSVTISKKTAFLTLCKIKASDELGTSLDDLGIQDAVFANEYWNGWVYALYGKTRDGRSWSSACLKKTDEIVFKLKLL